MRRIGLFGGSFDPVHLGHVALARAALDSLGLDEVLWIPAGQPWQKARRLAAPEHRAAMVALAIAGEPRFRLERSELNRSGPSYTIDTVRELQHAMGMVATDWVLLLGQDQYAGLPTWHGWRDLLQRVTLAVALRGAAPPAPPALAAAPHRRLEIAMPPVAVSSTEIRERLATGRGVDGMVPPEVARYIALHGLYQAPDHEPDSQPRGERKS
jgi:nicotinate-nucleotide adenylyltransferase